MATINGKKVNNAKMYDKYLYDAAGITNDYKPSFALRDSFHELFEELDLQESIRSFRWYNLPSGLTGEFMERVLYYKGTGMFFYMKDNDKFYFLPYSLSGNIDVTGKFLAVTPLPFGGPTDNEKGKDKPWIPGMVKFPVYDLGEFEDEELDFDGLASKCILLFDRSRGYATGYVKPRAQKVQAIVDVMSEIPPMIRTSNLSNCGISGMRVPGEDAKQEVYDTSNAIYAQAMSGDIYAPITANLEFQELGSTGAGNVTELLTALQSFDNIRLRTIGINNGGMQQKQAHMLQVEADTNNGKAELTFQDKLLVRQQFCDYVNYVFGLDIYCEPDESLMQFDANQDGYYGSQEDQSGESEGEQPNFVGGGE